MRQSLSGLGENFIMVQYALTALSSGLNAGYFWRYRSRRKGLRVYPDLFRVASRKQGRRIGATVLAVLSLGLLLESVYLELFTLFHGRLFFLALSQVAARTLLSLGSLAISALILRRVLRHWRIG